MSDNIKSALQMTIAMAGFAGNDALLKYIFDDIGLYQSILMRGIFATILLGLVCWHRGAFKGASANMNSLVFLRVSGEVGGTICFLSALVFVSLADASAILQIVPLVVTIAAAVFLGERVSARRFIAIFIGLVGVLVIIRPGGDDFNPYYLIALLTVLFITLRDIATRKLKADISTEFVAFLTSFGVTLIGVIGIFFEAWVPLSTYQLIILFGAAASLVVGYLGTVLAFRQGDVGFIAPFIYTYLLWAMLLSVLLFGDYPDGATTIGSIIVVVAGLYCFWLERRETGSISL